VTVLTEQAANAVDRGSALLDEPLSHTVNRQPGLRVLALDRDKAHVRPLNRFANGLGVSRVVLATPTTESVRSDELRRDDPDIVAELGELARPVVST